jgi:hypothetical protein
MSSHKATLEAIRKTRAVRRLLAEKNDPAISCRREFRRENTSQVVEFWLLDGGHKTVARGRALLLDYSPNGAKIGELQFDEGFWPDGDFTVSLRITGGEFEGVRAQGRPLRFATSDASMAIRFDALYVKL